MINTRKEIISNIEASLEPLYGAREACSMAAMTVEKLLGWTRNDLLIRGSDNIEITTDQHQAIETVINELKTFRPIQYVLGECEFYGLRLRVREGVLIPRPETEELVAWMLTRLQGTARILDIGTGSGAIALTLAANMKQASVWAMDISNKALDIASENARRLAVDVKFINADILDNSSNLMSGGEKYDAVVSNPPYVPSSDLQHIESNVKDYEPHLALFVPDNDPLLFYRAIARRSKEILNNGGQLFFEIYEKYGDDTVRLLESEGYRNIELREDLNCKPRMIACIKP